MKATRAILLTLAVAGCTGSTGVLPIGPDTYRVTAEGLGLSQTEGDALGAAGKHCASMGRQVAVQSMNSNPYTLRSYAAASVNFRCVE